MGKNISKFPRFNKAFTDKILSGLHGDNPGPGERKQPGGILLISFITKQLQIFRANRPNNTIN